jgi:hypothetical protein
MTFNAPIIKQFLGKDKESQSIVNFIAQIEK